VDWPDTLQVFVVVEVQIAKQRSGFCDDRTGKLVGSCGTAAAPVHVHSGKRQAAATSTSFHFHRAMGSKLNR
jgi:hypothetical protein